MAKRLTQIEKAIADIDADIAATQAKANEHINVLHHAKARLVQQQRAKPTRKPKARTLEAVKVAAGSEG